MLGEPDLVIDESLKSYILILPLVYIRQREPVIDSARAGLRGFGGLSTFRSGYQNFGQPRSDDKKKVTRFPPSGAL
jgi:hypothetical protein